MVDKDNILISSVRLNLEKRLVLGTPKENLSVTTYNTIKKSLEYSIQQYDAGVITPFQDVINSMDKLLFDYKFSCNEICT